LPSLSVSKNQNSTACDPTSEETNESGGTKEQTIILAGLTSVRENGGTGKMSVTDTDTLLSTRQRKDTEVGTGKKIDEALRKNHISPVADQPLEIANESGGINKDGSTLTRYLSGRENGVPGKVITAVEGVKVKTENDIKTGQVMADGGAVHDDEKEQPTAKYEYEREDDSTGLLAAMSTADMNVTGATNGNNLTGSELQGIKIPGAAMNESRQDKERIQVFVKGQEMSVDKNAAKENGSSTAPAVKATSAKEAAKSNLNMFNGLADNTAPEEINLNNDSPRISVQNSKAAQAIKESSTPITVTPENHSLTAETTNAARMETLQTLWMQANDKLKTDSKSKDIPVGKVEEDISLGFVSTPAGTAAKAGKATDVNSSAIIGQVANEIKENASTDGGRIKIMLNPPSLGELEMDVIIRNNKVEVVLTANNKDVQQVLNSNLDQLKSTLLNQGLTVERCDVLMQDKHDEFYRSFGNQAYYQDRSGRGGKEGRQQRDKEQSGVIPVTGKAVVIPKVSAGIDTISLFA
jgi:flagellar hook-length control protein FliK